MKRWPLIIQAVILLCGLLFLFVIDECPAAQVTLAWDANNPAPQGYRLYQRTQSTSYTTPVWQGTATQATITGLAENTYYFYVVRAFIGADESGNSNEVNFISPTPSPTPVPPTPTPIPPSPTPEPTSTPVTTPQPTTTPTPTSRCYHITDSGGFVETLSPGVTYYIEESNGKVWLFQLSELRVINYTGNILSHTFHKEGCRYFNCLSCTKGFSTREEAIAAGYSPCGICKP